MFKPPSPIVCVLGKAQLALLAVVLLSSGPGAAHAGPFASKPTTQPAEEAPVEAVDGATVTDLMPLEKRGGAFMVKVGKKPERETDFTVEAVEENMWKATLEGIRVTYFQRGDRGETLLPREDDLSENVQVTYQPALQILPGSWADGRAVEGTSDVVIKNLKTGLVREKGTCSYRVELVGKQKIQTPAGLFEAILVRETRHIRLKLAKSDVTILNWYVPGKGEVGEHVVESTKALGFIGGKKESETRLSK